MTERSTQVAPPPTLDLKRLSDPSFTIKGQARDGAVLVHFDPDQHVGAIYHLEAACWAVWGPIPLAGFVNSLRGRGIVIGDGEDLARWIAACDAITPDAGSKRAH